MEIRTLRSFLAVAREGNVTRAASSLHITQPALSRQLAELERELGCELLVREPRGVTLTDEGMLLRKRAEEIVSLADRTELEMRSPVAEVSGDVWVGGGESRVVELVARAASRLASEHPGVRLRIFSGNADAVMERIEKGLLDFGIVIGHDPGNHYEQLELAWEDRWGVLVRKDDPLANQEQVELEDLRDRALIVSAQSHGHIDSDPTLAFFDERGFNVVATYTLLYNATLLVEQGVGVAVCFDGIVQVGEGSPFAFVPVIGLPAVGSRMVWKRHQPLSRAANVFLVAMRELCT